MNLVIQRHRDTVVVRLPVHTVSEPNVRDGHWRRASRAKAQRSIVAMSLRHIAGTLALPVRVLITRVAPRQLDDDNLRGALKACRDGCADAFETSDRDARLTWLYDQRRSEQGGEGWTAMGYGVEISITGSQS